MLELPQCPHSPPCLQMIPVLACRVEPAEGAGGYVAVDGEPIASGSRFQVTCSRLAGTVIGREQ